jgi:hypothetical protein
VEGREVGVIGFCAKQEGLALELFFKPPQMGQHHVARLAQQRQAQ